MKNAVEIENLSKKYQIPIRADGATAPFLRRSHVTDFWALKDVNLEIPKGKMLGVIGRNGSGKSTLLKIISGILEPSSGCVRTDGRVTALLELGAGFHDELSGMENIFLNGAALGFSKKDILQKLPSIIEFSGLADFIYTPIKHYSSGMQARLGFSVAIHMNPEILLIDEVISVGDQDFKYKCVSRIGEFRKRKKTIILVTHDVNIANFLCDDILWLENGGVRMFGTAAQVAHEYQSLIHKGEDVDATPCQITPSPPFSSFPVIRKVRFLNDAGEPRSSFLDKDDMIIEITYDSRDHPMERPLIRIDITRSDNLMISRVDSSRWGFSPNRIEGKGRILVRFSPVSLLKNMYDVEFTLCDRNDPKRIYAFRSGMDRFEVGFQAPHLRPGMVFNPPCAWSLSEQT